MRDPSLVKAAAMPSLHRTAPPPAVPWRNLAAMALCGAAALGAQAGRPLATEDAGVLATRDCELELYAAHQRLQPAGRLQAASAQATCGVGHGVQAALALERRRLRGTDDAGRADAGVLSAKVQLAGDAASPEQPGDAAEAEGPALALVAAAGWGRSGDGAWHREALWVGLAGSMPLAAGLTGHANLGHLHNRADHQRSTHWALALEAATSATLDLGLELYGDDRERPWIGSGLRWAATPTLSLGASAAQQAGRGRARLFTVGLTAGF